MNPRRSRITILPVTLALAGLLPAGLAPSVLLAGQAPATTTQVAQDPSKPSRPPEYVVGPGDLLAIDVFGVPQLSQTVRVSNSGKIRVVNAGVLQVYGRTVPELEQAVGQELKAKGLVNDPWVRIHVTQYRSNPVYILGEVFQPGQYVIKGKMTLLELVANAQGLTPKAEPIGFLYRLPAGEPPATPGADAGTGTFQAEEVLQVDLAALAQGRAPELNVDLRGGDVLYVRESLPTYYYVVGEVNRPGMYEIPSGYREQSQPILLSQAIANAGGTAITAKSSQSVLVRSGENGVQQQVPFNLGDVLRGRQPDLPVQAHDILFVPGSNIKTIGYGLLGLLPNLASMGALAPIR